MRHSIRSAPDTVEELRLGVLDDERRWRRQMNSNAADRHYDSPTPDSVGDLPEGWVLVAAAPSPAGEQILLVERLAGGWMLLRRVTSTGDTRRAWLSATLADLYAEVRSSAARPTAGSTVSPVAFRWLVPVSAWLRTIIASMFDPDDAQEAAEGFLFALTGELTVLPRTSRVREATATVSAG